MQWMQMDTKGVQMDANGSGWKHLCFWNLVLCFVMIILNRPFSILLSSLDMTLSWLSGFHQRLPQPQPSNTTLDCLPNFVVVASQPALSSSEATSIVFWKSEIELKENKLLCSFFRPIANLQSRAKSKVNWNCIEGN